MIVKNLRKLNTQQIISLVVVTASTFALLLTLHPDLIFSNNTPTGGDMGAHVYGPAFLRDFLLPHFRLTGWSNDWYAGFPMYRFYMLIPALAVLMVDLIAPYGIAKNYCRDWHFGYADLYLVVRQVCPVSVSDSRAIDTCGSCFFIRREFHNLRRQYRLNNGG